MSLALCGKVLHDLPEPSRALFLQEQPDVAVCHKPLKLDGLWYRREEILYTAFQGVDEVRCYTVLGLWGAGSIMSMSEWVCTLL